MTKYTYYLSTVVVIMIIITIMMMMMTVLVVVGVCGGHSCPRPCTKHFHILIFTFKGTLVRGY